jgi:hypothetical protein
VWFKPTPVKGRLLVLSKKKEEKKRLVFVYHTAKALLD